MSESSSSRATHWRKKPVVIQAHRWFKNGDHPEDNSGRMQPEITECEGTVVRYFRHPSVPGQQVCSKCGTTMHVHGWIDTLEDGHNVCPGDWIITGVKGERYACKPDVFALTYEPDPQGEDRKGAGTPDVHPTTIPAGAGSAPSSTGTLTFEDYWKSIGRPDYSPSARSVIEDAFRTGQRTRSATEPKWLVRAGGDNYETWLCPGTDEVRKAFCEALYGDVASADAEDIEGYMRDLDKRIIEDNDVRWTFEDGWLEVIALNNPTDGGNKEKP